ncbi:fructosamine kinase family protein [Corynebacterium gerontici]|uniref:Fructosamine kinase n=1 Tax=Corynebacterium gerontici TaxID=2079234 RepID=A0A3G6J1S7_9CORY|nr:fructosamine kinase family protein [Corynebacterium gerontici]AZA12011.1 Fructosamine kinase [Corynebacterium gerontici]
MNVFEKRPLEPQSALAEAAGLRWLRQASSAVVQVIDADSRRICTEAVTLVAPSADAAFRAGVELARIHAASAPSFGSPPQGWEGPNYIGTQRQECRPSEHWAEFYVEQRVLPFAREADRVGNLSRLGVVERACEAILGNSQALSWPSPARIHGDLWAGNLLFGAEGPRFIDPAAHGGHPYTDLAMLELFGAPHLRSIWEGYAHQAGWDSDRVSEARALIPLHQLHPVAVHAVTHGPSYGSHLEELARTTLRML